MAPTAKMATMELAAADDGLPTPIAVDPRNGHREHRTLRTLRLVGDSDLVTSVRAGDERAFEAMHERHSSALLGFARHMLGSQQEAEDAVQQTFFKAYRTLHANENEILLKPWLYAIARNECISMIRRRRIREADPLEDESQPSASVLAETVEQREDLRALLSGISRLPGDQRQALLLTSLGSLSGEEIGQILGCDRAKVKSLVFRARASLARIREAHETSCEEIRRQLAELRGGALRRRVLREHLLACDGCNEFLIEIRRQRELVGSQPDCHPKACEASALTSHQPVPRRAHNWTSAVIGEEATAARPPRS